MLNMEQRPGKPKRVLFAIYIICLHLVLVYFVGEKLIAYFLHSTEIRTAAVADPTKPEQVPTPLPLPSVAYDPEAAEVNSNPTPPLTIPQPTAGGLIIPVAGIRPEQLTDSYSDSRSEGRVHDAIDIMAPAGTPVLAAADGEIVKLFDSELGGITIYQLTKDRKFVLYYAHLQKRADDIAVGNIVERGRTIGYVGDTGNAGAGNYHLHFSISVLTDPKRYWEGTNINPFPILKGQASLPAN
jgi:peptidoglycan LD-endopeptidase LytH